MKKIITSIIAVAASCAALCTVSVSAAESVNVYVTIADENGDLALIQEEISVTDTDGDGALTINDALYLAHEKKFEGGAASGYTSSNTEFGISLDKLWGAENGGSYGYYLNHGFSNGLADSVSEGDLVSAFVYTDLQGWSDKYCWFDIDRADAVQGDEITLELDYLGFDDEWNNVTLPVEGAVISINGEPTAYTTDAQGKVTVKVNQTGKNIISAASDQFTLVPPVCVVNVAQADEDASDDETQGNKPTVTTTAKPVSVTTTTAKTTAKPGSVPKTGDSITGIAAALSLAAAGVYISRRKK